MMEKKTACAGEQHTHTHTLKRKRIPPTQPHIKQVASISVCVGVYVWAHAANVYKGQIRSDILARVFECNLVKLLRYSVPFLSPFYVCVVYCTAICAMCIT